MLLRPTYWSLLEAGEWRDIPGCPGRAVLQGRHDVSPEDLVGVGVSLARHEAPAARDPVWVAEVDGGGLISYHRSDGTWVHTLNTPEGFARKLGELGIRP